MKYRSLLINQYFKGWHVRVQRFCCSVGSKKLENSRAISQKSSGKRCPEVGARKGASGEEGTISKFLNLDMFVGCFFSNGLYHGIHRRFSPAFGIISCTCSKHQTSKIQVHSCKRRWDGAPPKGGLVRGHDKPIQYMGVVPSGGPGGINRSQTSGVVLRNFVNQRSLPTNHLPKPKPPKPNPRFDV